MLCQIYNVGCLNRVGLLPLPRRGTISFNPRSPRSIKSPLPFSFVNNNRFSCFTCSIKSAVFSCCFNNHSFSSIISASPAVIRRLAICWRRDSTRSSLDAIERSSWSISFLIQCGMMG